MHLMDIHFLNSTLQHHQITFFHFSIFPSDSLCSGYMSIHYLYTVDSHASNPIPRMHAYADVKFSTSASLLFPQLLYLYLYERGPVNV